MCGNFPNFSSLVVFDTQKKKSGNTQQCIQLAINSLPQSGGCVKLCDGTFEVHAPLRLKSNVKLLGSEKTILRKCEGFKLRLRTDGDYAESEVEVEDSGKDLLAVGAGVKIFDDLNCEGRDVSVAIITAMDTFEHTVFLDTQLERKTSNLHEFGFFNSHPAFFF